MNGFRTPIPANHSSLGKGKRPLPDERTLDLLQGMFILIQKLFHGNIIRHLFILKMLANIVCVCRNIGLFSLKSGDSLVVSVIWQKGKDLLIFYPKVYADCFIANMSVFMVFTVLNIFLCSSSLKW